MTVKWPAASSKSGEDEWMVVRVDECIADLVDGLQRRGIATRSSCCGHGEMEGYISLPNGMDLLVLNDEQAAMYSKWRRLTSRTLAVVMNEELDAGG